MWSITRPHSPGDSTPLRTTYPSRSYCAVCSRVSPPVLMAAVVPRPRPNRHAAADGRSEEHTSELQSRQYLVCRLLLEKNKHSLFTPVLFSRSSYSLLCSVSFLSISLPHYASCPCLHRVYSGLYHSIDVFASSCFS